MTATTIEGPKAVPKPPRVLLPEDPEADAVKGA
jgi:hypothetical protein